MYREAEVTDSRSHSQWVAKVEFKPSTIWLKSPLSSPTNPNLP